MKFKVKTAGSLKTAENAIKRVSRDKNNFQAKIDLIRDAYAITHDDRLISRKIPFGTRFGIAYQYLLDLINKQLKIHELEEEAEKQDKDDEEDESLEPREAEPTPPRAETRSEEEEQTQESTEIVSAGRTDIEKVGSTEIQETEEVDSTELSSWVKEVEEEFKEEYGDEYSIPEPEEVEIVDYYEVLGVNPDASLEEIKKARKRQYRIHHPDVSDLPPEEAHERALLIDEAYSILSDEKARRNYDSSLKKAKRTSKRSDTGTYTYPYEPPKQREDVSESTEVAVYTAPAGRPPKLIKKDAVEGGLLLSIVPSERSDVDKALAIKQTQDLYDNFLIAGDIEYDQETIDMIKAAIPNIPEGKENEILNAGMFTFMSGVHHERIQNAIDQTKMTQEEFDTINSIKEVNEILYAGAPEVGDQRARANDFPEFEIKRSSAETPPGENQILINQGLEIVYNKAREKIDSLISEKFGDTIKGKITGELKDQAISKAKTATKKFVKESVEKGIKKLGKTAVKKTGKFLSKRGIIAAISSLTEFVGGPVAHILTDIALEAIVWVAEKIGAIIRKLIPESIRKRSKEIAAAGFIGMGIGLITGSVGLIAVGGGAVLLGGLGSVAGFSATVGGSIALIVGTITAAATGFILWITVAVFGTILLIAISIYMITAGAYVVPFSDLSLITGTSNVIGGDLDSAYMDVEKTLDQPGGWENTDLPMTVTYTISVNSTAGTLSNISFQYTCRVSREGGSIDCPEIDSDPNQPGNQPIPDPPQVINEGEPFTFTYTQHYDAGTFDDSLIFDRILVTADSDEETGTQESASASISFGDPPAAECFEFNNTGNSQWGVTALNWNDYPSIQDRMLNIIADLSQSSMWSSLVCNGGPVILTLAAQAYDDATGYEYGGWQPGSDDIILYIDGAFGYSYNSTLYTFAHESGHVIDDRNGQLQPAFQPVAANEGYLPSYPLQSTLAEDFAETIGTFPDPRHQDMLDSYPLHRQFALQYIYGIQF